MPTIKIKNKVEPCVSEPKLEFENDELYLRTPLRQYGEGIYDTRLVMTKEIFQECYKRWIDPRQEPCENAISRQAVKEKMIKYGFHAPDMTVTEFVEDLLP